MIREICTLACLLQLLCATAFSQDGSSVRSAYYSQVAGEYTISDKGQEISGAGNGSDWKLQSLMSWTSIQEFDGSVFVWTRNGRPEVVASIFSFPGDVASRRKVVHEFVSFTKGQLQISQGNGTSWSPEPLTTWTLLPGNPTTGQTSNQLKLQARSLAKEFTASLNRLGEVWELRLLPKPLMEHSSVDQATKYSALFAFVGYSTDPELLLMLEARETSEGTSWYYAPGRLSNKSLFLNYRGTPIWKSLRRGHGSTEPDEEDSRYRVLHQGSEDLEKMLKQP